MQKKSGFVLAAFVLVAFALFVSPVAASAETAATLQPAQTIEAPAPVAPVQSPVVPAATVTPASAMPDLLGVIGRPVCRCSKNSQCGTGGACCWWPKQTCGICC
ncbi:MAG TPA: hypothetical protein VF173_10260 [Thermoanaerobaculia bacterium]|nr:hypothetical protein [Thermoanaerobaculia bacterium]